MNLKLRYKKYATIKGAYDYITKYRQTLKDMFTYKYRS